MYGLCGSRGPSKTEHIEHLRRQRNSLQTDIQNLRGQLNASQATERSLSDQLSEIQVRLTSFLEDNRSKTSPSVETNLEAVFWTYSALAERSATDKRDAEGRIDNLKAQLVAKGNEMDEQRRKLREEAERELRAKDKELKDLEKKLIIGADYFQPKPDSELTYQFNRLQEIIRTFAEDAKPGAPQHTSRLPFAQNVKQRYQQPIPSNHLSHFLEEFLWTILIENVFKTPFSVFGTHGEELVPYWCNFFPDGQLKKEARIVCPQPNSFSERWRALTIGNLAAAVRGKQNGPEARRIKSSYRSNCNKVAAALQEEYRKASEIQVEGTIDRITELACNIALTCGVERLRVQLAFPEEGTLISRDGNE